MILSIHKALHKLEVHISLLHPLSPGSALKSQSCLSSEPLLPSTQTCPAHLPLDITKHLGMAQEAAEIYMEHVPCGFQHDVVIVSVTDAQDVRSHTTASTRVDEVLHSLWEWRQAVGLQPALPCLSSELQQYPAPACPLSSYTKAHACVHRNIFHVFCSRRWKACVYMHPSYELFFPWLEKQWT